MIRRTKDIPRQMRSILFGLAMISILIVVIEICAICVLLVGIYVYIYNMYVSCQYW